MKLFAYAAAAALALMTGAAPVAVSAPATAAPQPQPQFQERRVVRERVVVRRDDGRYRSRQRVRTVCRNTWRNGNRRRVCRTVRR